MSRRLAVVLLFVCACCASGCRQHEFGSKLDPQQSARVSTLASLQIQSQYRAAVDSTPGYREIDAAFTMLASHADSLPPGVTLRLKILETPEQFSMSLPDGHLYLAAGLVRLVADSPGEAAALVAHQIGHIAGNHDAINLAAALGQDDLVSMLDQGKYQDVVNTELQLQRLSYTNEQEYDADRYAVHLLAVSGYDTVDLSRLVTRLAAQPADSDIVPWRDSHPVSKSRVSRIHDAATALR